jgi:hypothetical protein
MKRFVITEQEKDDILNQHKEMMDKPKLPENRKILDFDITPISLLKFKSQGLTPYYYDGDTDIIEINGPIKGKKYNTKPKEVFLLTPDEYDKIKKISDNIKEMIELKLKSIKLYKQYIPSSLEKLIEKNN